MQLQCVLLARAALLMSGAARERFMIAFRCAGLDWCGWASVFNVTSLYNTRALVSSQPSVTEHNTCVDGGSIGTLQKEH